MHIAKQAVLTSPLDLVLERLFQLLSSHDHFQLPFLSVLANKINLKLCFLLVGKDTRRLLEYLTYEHSEDQHHGSTT